MRSAAFGPRRTGLNTRNTVCAVCTYLSDLVGTVGQLMGVLLDAPGVVGRGRAVDAGVVGGQGWWRFGGLLDQLEDGQSDGYDEREE